MVSSRQKRLRLAVYERVSTVGQAQDGYGLEVQHSTIEQWAKREGYRIVKVCTDAGVSGTVEALDRAGLSCAIGAIEDGEADALVVLRLDRLARSLSVQEAVLAMVWERGGQVFTAESGLVPENDPDDPLRECLRKVTACIAELDRAMVNKRLRDGRKAKQAKGGYVAGSPPYGLRADGGELVPDVAEQKVLRRMRKLRASGATLAAIANALNEEGVPSKRGYSWSPSSVSRVIDPAAKERAREATRVARAR